MWAYTRLHVSSEGGIRSLSHFVPVFQTVNNSLEIVTRLAKHPAVKLNSAYLPYVGLRLVLWVWG